MKTVLYIATLVLISILFGSIMGLWINHSTDLMGTIQFSFAFLYFVIWYYTRLARVKELRIQENNPYGPLLIKNKLQVFRIPNIFLSASLLSLIVYFVYTIILLSYGIPLF